MLYINGKKMMTSFHLTFIIPYFSFCNTPHPHSPPPSDAALTNAPPPPTAAQSPHGDLGRAKMNRGGDAPNIRSRQRCGGVHQQKAGEAGDPRRIFPIVGGKRAAAGGALRRRPRLCLYR